MIGPLSLVGATALLIAAVGCGSSEFSGSSDKSKVRPTVADADGTKHDEKNPKISNDPSLDRDTDGKAGDNATDKTGKSATLVDTFETSTVSSTPVDIVVLMDTSGSMREEKLSLEQNMQLFMDQLKAAKIDAHVTAVGTGFRFPVLPADVFGVVPQLVGSHDAIGIMIQYLSGAYGFPLALRKEAAMEAVIFTDDDGQGVGNTAADFTAFAKGRDIRINAVVGQKVGTVSATCKIENIGSQAKQLAVQTKGSDLDLCAPDWTVLIKQLTSNIVKRNEADGYRLTKKPDSKQDVKVKINGVLLDADKFKLNFETGLLTLSVDLKLKGKEKIEVEYRAKAN